MSRRPYPSDVSDEEWIFVAPYLILMDQEAPQRQHDLREVFNALRWVERSFGWLAHVAPRYSFDSIGAKFITRI